MLHRLTKWMVMTLLFLASLLLTLGIGAFFLQNRLVFPGQGRCRDGEFDEIAGKGRSNMALVPVQTATGSSTWLQVLTPQAELPDPNRNDRFVILFFYGNGGRLRWFPELAQNFLASDCDAACVEWPGYGIADGTPSEKACYDAADIAWDTLLHRFGYQADHIICAGHSLGAAVACDLASRRPAAALILYSAFTSLPDAAWFHYHPLPVRLLLTSHFDNEEKITKVTCPILLIHGTADTIVPWSMAVRNQELARNAGHDVTLFPLHGKNHNLFGEEENDLILPELTRFVKRVRAETGQEPRPNSPLGPEREDSEP